MSKSKHKKDVGKFRSHFELEVAGKLGEENYEFYKQRWQGVLDSIQSLLIKGDNRDEQS